MLCSCMGRAETETHHLIFLDIDCSQIGPFEVFIRETRLEWKTIKMVNPISRI